MIAMAALIVGIVATSLIALTVYTQNKKYLPNRLFLLLGVCIIGWSVTTYFSLRASTDSQTLCWIRWIMCFVVLQNTAIYALVQVFPYSKPHPFRGRRQQLFFAYSLVTALVAISSFLFARFSNNAPQPGPGMALFLLHALTVIIGGMSGLVAKYRRAEGSERAQLRYFLAGMFLLLTVEPACNFIMPVLLQNNALVTFSPLYAIVFSGFIAYAMIRHRLFDIRFLVVRASAYVFSVAIMSVFYVGPAILLILHVLHVNISLPAFVFLIISCLALTIAYRYVHRLFDAVTMRIFYRDYYEPQEVLNQLSKVLVRSIDLAYIRQHTAKILQNAIKTKDCGYWLAADTTNHTAQHAQQLESLFRARRTANLVTVEEPTFAPDIVRHLHENHIAVVVRLRTTTSDLGFLTLGFKESGEDYTDRDKRLLSIASDEIAIALQNAIQFEETQHFNRRLQQKVDEATRQLRRTNEKLQTLDATKDEFISMASHQLRTPLTSVKGYLSMVLEGDVGPINAQQRQMLEQSYNSSQRMVYLISDLLNLSRLNTGKFVIESTSVDLGEVVQAEVEQLTETAKSRGLSLVYHRPSDFPRLMLDETKIHQVVMNLIDNAIYYTPSGGTVTVDLRETASAVEFRVTDTGIGVPKKVQHKLFSKFYRAGNAQAARPDGTGLGLFMAKKVVAAQGGAILFESTEGKGSTFGFRFTKAKHVTPTVSTGVGDPTLTAAQR